MPAGNGKQSQRLCPMSREGALATLHSEMFESESRQGSLLLVWMSERAVDQRAHQGQIAQSIIGSPWAHAIMNSILGNQNPYRAVCTRTENGRECVKRRSNSVAGSNRLKHFPHSARSEWRRAN